MLIGWLEVILQTRRLEGPLNALMPEPDMDRNVEPSSHTPLTGKQPNLRLICEALLNKKIGPRYLKGPRRKDCYLIRTLIRAIALVA